MPVEIWRQSIIPAVTLVSICIHFTTSLLMSNLYRCTSGYGCCHCTATGTVTHLFNWGLCPFTLHTGPLFDMYPHKPHPVMPMSDTEFCEGTHHLFQVVMVLTNWITELAPALEESNPGSLKAFPDGLYCIVLCRSIIWFWTDTGTIKSPYFEISQASDPACKH